MSDYLEIDSDVGINSIKKSLNVDSPSFTPATLSVPGRSAAISSQAAAAAPFTPRGIASGMAWRASVRRGWPNQGLSHHHHNLNPKLLSLTQRKYGNLHLKIMTSLKQWVLHTLHCTPEQDTKSDVICRSLRMAQRQTQPHSTHFRWVLLSKHYLPLNIILI